MTGNSEFGELLIKDDCENNQRCIFYDFGASTGVEGPAGVEMFVWEMNMLNCSQTIF